MLMKTPPQPGKVIRELCLKPLNLSVTKAAQVLEVSCETLSSLLNSHSGISSEMVVWLSKVFGGSTKSWLTQQMQYDLAQANQKADQITVCRYESGQGTYAF